MTFAIDQVGLPAGAFDKSRTDGLLSGALVTLTAAAGGSTRRFRFLWVPPGDTSAVASLTAVTPFVWTFLPTPGVWGTYRIELIVDEGLATESRSVRLFRVRNSAGLTDFALNERASPQNSLANTTGASEDNADDYPDPAIAPLTYAGWWRIQHELVQTVAALLVGGAGTGVVDTIGRLAGSGLRGIVGTVGQAILARGYDTAGDDGGGLFVWVPTTAPNNDGTIIVPGVAYGSNATGGHWRRVQTGALNVRWFGAKGDYNPDAGTGGTNDDLGFQRAMAALSLAPSKSAKRTLIIPDGIYKITTKIVVRSNYALLGEGRPILWGVGVSTVIEIGIISPPDLAANADVLDITILGGSGGGVAAVNAYATQACRIRVYVGGSWTYGLLSQIVGVNGGIAYSSVVEVYRFSYIASIDPFAAPAVVTNLVWIEGAWTNTDLRVEAYQHAGHGVYYKQVNPAGLGSIKLSGMAQGCAVAVEFDRASTYAIRDFYCEGNTTDVLLKNSFSGEIKKVLGRVTATNCRGLKVDGTLRLDADETNTGVSTDGTLATDVAPAASLLAKHLGVVGAHVADEVARQGVWVPGSVPAERRNLFVNGAMLRWKTSGATLLWGASSWTSATTVKCGTGLADTTRTFGSPFCARVKETIGLGGGLPIKLCGPLGDQYVGAEITVQFKLKVATAGVGAFVQLSDLTVSGIASVPSPTIVDAGGTQPEAIPAENGFVIYRYTWTVTQAVADHGAQLLFVMYAGTEFYISELEAVLGRSAGLSYQLGAALDGSVFELPGGALQVFGTAAPVGADEPYWADPWLPGDRCRNSDPSSGEPVEWVFDGTTWQPVYPAQLEPVSTALTTYPLTAADFGRVLRFTAAGAISVTVPTGLPSGFSVSLVQGGAGQITVSGAATINGRNGLKSAGQYAVMGVQAVAADTYVVGGDTTP